jgi:hypothetical protein
MKGKWVIGVALVVWIVAGGLLQRARATPIIEPLLGAYQMIQPISAVIRFDGQETDAPAALYNGDGLTHHNPLLAEHGNDPDTIWQFPITPDRYPVAIEFDLGGEFLVNEMWVWQLRGLETSDQGIDDFDVIMKDASGREIGTRSASSDQLKRGGVGPVQRFNAFGECIFLPFPDCIRFVELRIRSNLGDPNYVGLAEISFAGRQKLTNVPEPASLTLIGLASLVGAMARSRIRENSESSDVAELSRVVRV